MMENNNNLTIDGVVIINGEEVHNIFGEFGENQKSALVKEIANVHGVELKHLNEKINRNIKRFRFGIDIVDLKGTESEVVLIYNKIFTQNSVNRSNNIYLLSKSGYEILCSILENTEINIINKIFEVCFDTYNTNIILLTRYENEFKNLLFSILEDFITVKCQFPILQYRVDFFIPELSLIIEYDEEGHSHKINEDALREENIQNEFKRWEEEEYVPVKIIRVNKNDELKSIKEIMKIVSKYDIVKEIFIKQNKAYSNICNLYDYYLEVFSKEYCDSKNILGLKASV